MIENLHICLEQKIVIMIFLTEIIATHIELHKQNLSLSTKKLIITVLLQNYYKSIVISIGLSSEQIKQIFTHKNKRINYNPQNTQLVPFDCTLNIT